MKTLTQTTSSPEAAERQNCETILYCNYLVKIKPLLAEFREYVAHDGLYDSLASSPQVIQPFRIPRPNISRYGPGEQSSIRRYCSSGLRECSRFSVSIMFTCRRAGASVRAFLPRTPKSMSSV